MPSDADEARQLANLFASMSETVDAYRTQHFTQLTPQERDQLEQKIQQLDDIHDGFTATAIQDTLNAIQSSLDRITSVTTQAQQSLQHLNTVAAIARVVSAASELAEDIFTADYGAIPQAIEDVVQAIAKTSDKNSSGGDPSGAELT